MTETVDIQTIADQILMLERGALDRWGNGDRTVNSSLGRPRIMTAEVIRDGT